MAGTTGSAGRAEEPANHAADRPTDDRRARPDPVPPGRHELAVLVLAAGEGRRLRPLTWVRPKPLCPVLHRPLLDWAIGRVDAVDPGRSLPVVVNAHHGGALVVEHLARSGALAGWIGADGSLVEGADGVAPGGDLPRPPLAVQGRLHASVDGARSVLVSAETEGALGTSGAVGRIAPWLDGRGVLVLNADTYTTLDLAPLLDGWDGTSHRVLVAGGGGFGPGALVAGALVPWPAAARLAATPSGLWETCWRDAAADAALEAVAGRGVFVDCGTPARYIEANLAALATATGGAGSWEGEGAIVTGAVEGSVVGAGAVVEGRVEGSVIWPGAHVRAGEHLRSAVRTPATSSGQPLTVVVR